MMRSFLKQEA